MAADGGALAVDKISSDVRLPYETLFVGTGVYNTDRTIDIKHQEFAHGYSVYIIRFIPGEPDAPSFDLVQNGTIRLDLKFTDLIPSTATAIVYAKFDSFVENDKERNTTMDC